MARMLKICKDHEDLEMVSEQLEACMNDWLADKSNILKVLTYIVKEEEEYTPELGHDIDLLTFAEEYIWNKIPKLHAETKTTKYGYQDT